MLDYEQNREFNARLRSRILAMYADPLFSRYPTFAGAEMATGYPDAMLEIEPETIEVLTTHSKFNQLQIMCLTGLINFRLTHWPRELRNITGTVETHDSCVEFFDSLPTNLTRVDFMTKQEYTYEEVAALTGFLSRCTNLQIAFIHVPPRLDSHPELVIYEWIRSTFKRNSNIINIQVHSTGLVSLTNRIILDEMTDLVTIRLRNANIRKHNENLRFSFKKVIAVLISASLAPDLVREVRSFMLHFRAEEPEPEFL